MSSPGSLLQTLANTRSPDTFNSLILAKYLGPALDALPSDQRANLLAILQEAERASYHDAPLHFDKLDLNSDSDSEDDCQTVGFEPRSRKIKALLAMKANSQLVAEEIVDWLSILWKVGAERGLESRGVHAALGFCKDVEYVRTLGSHTSNSRTLQLRCGYSAGNHKLKETTRLHWNRASQHPHRLCVARTAHQTPLCRRYRHYDCYCPRTGE